jgi:hypothetical protein
MRAVLLAENYGIFKDEIMILAFNQEAAREIESRIQET